MEHKKIVKQKGCLDRVRYINLKKEELEIIPGDLVQHSDSDSSVDYIFVRFREDGTGKYAECREDVKIRSFHLDSIKKSARQLKKEKKSKPKKNGKTRNIH